MREWDAWAVSGFSGTRGWVRALLCIPRRVRGAARRAWRGAARRGEAKRDAAWVGGAKWGG